MTGLSPRLLELALWCANEELKARYGGKTPGPQQWNRELIRTLELELATASPSRQDGADAAPCLKHAIDDWIGTREAARILRWHERQVQRLAADLDGKKVGGKLVFRASVVREYAEAMSDDDLASA